MQTAIPLKNVYHIHIIAFMVYIFITLILRKKIINKSFNIKLIKIIMTEFLSETFSNLMILQHLSTSSRNMTKNLQRRSLSENALLMLRSRTATKSQQKWRKGDCALKTGDCLFRSKGQKIEKHSLEIDDQIQVIAQQRHQLHRKQLGVPFLPKGGVDTIITLLTS